jgi:hypothetical protein
MLQQGLGTICSPGKAHPSLRFECPHAQLCKVVKWLCVLPPEAVRNHIVALGSPDWQLRAHNQNLSFVVHILSRVVRE